jgi:hypothetical protein
MARSLAQHHRARLRRSPTAELLCFAPVSSTRKPRRVSLPADLQRQPRLRISAARGVPPTIERHAGLEHTLAVWRDPTSAFELVPPK